MKVYQITQEEIDELKDKIRLVSLEHTDPLNVGSDTRGRINDFGRHINYAVVGWLNKISS